MSSPMHGREEIRQDSSESPCVCERLRRGVTGNRGRKGGGVEARGKGKKKDEQRLRPAQGPGIVGGYSDQAQTVESGKNYGGEMVRVVRPRGAWGDQKSK